MNELERRTLLSAAGIGALAAMSKAGPLNPPAGPVASTGRTLDEVYNKIPDPLPGGTGDGRTPLSGGTSTVTISQPGSYVLTGNITSNGSTIVVAADNVSVDLNGFMLTATNSGANNITISGTRTMVRVRNGQLAGGFCGVNCLGAVKSVVIEDLSIIGVRSVGVMVTGSLSRAVTIRRCVITDTGITTIAGDTSAVAGIQYQGSNAAIQDCSVFRLFSNQSGVTTFRGITLFLNGQAGSVVERCRVMHDAPITGQGIHLNTGTSVYRDNTVVNFSSSYAVSAGNINGNGNVP